MIAVEDVVLRQGGFSLSGISFAVPHGKYGVLMGPTGCGKTSILEAIAGLRPIESGAISLAGVDISRSPPADRGIGYVPQDSALFATMTVREHLGFALMIRREPGSLIEKRVKELAGWLGIERILDRLPACLSGGEAQRVALGRALSFRPKYLLMDEPLSSLDEAMRHCLIELFRDLRKKGDVTVLHVTHSSQEAAELAEVLFRLEGGKIQEVGRG